MKKFQIVIRGGYGRTNFGDDALLVTLRDDYFYEYGCDKLSFSCYKSSYLLKYIPDFDVIPLNSDYSKFSNLLVYGGGTQFYAFTNSNQKNNLKEKFKNNKNLLLNPWTLINKLISVLKRKFESNQTEQHSQHIKIIAIGIGIGPFLLGTNKKEEDVKKLFKDMEFVGVRDVYSYEKCKEWGVKNLNLYSDLCFQMKHEMFYKESKTKTVTKIGIIVRDWDLTDLGVEYKSNLIRFSNILKEKGKDVVFLLFAKEKDLVWKQLIINKKERLEIWDPDNEKIDDFIKVLSNFDLFITSRYHGAIFSGMLGKPFIAIKIEQKLDLVHDLFKEGSEIWEEPFLLDDLKNKFDKIDLNYSIYSRNVLNTAIKQRELSKKMKKDLDSYLKK